MGMLREKESTQIAHYGEDVLIDRVNMKQVMLHPAHNASELRQIPPEHRPLVHQTQPSCGARRHLHEAHEEGSILGVLAKSSIDKGAGSPDRAQSAGCHSAQGGALGHS